MPDALARDFEEAAAVVGISARASAALARRCLQQTLVDHLGAAGGDLNKQIDAISSQLPSHVQDALHALRNIGNFAAHPIKVNTAGDVVDVESGEADWTLEVLEQLFDLVFVAPAKAAARTAALNKKLASAGKPTIYGCRSGGQIRRVIQKAHAISGMPMMTKRRSAILRDNSTANLRHLSLGMRRRRIRSALR
ncbi:MAG TPA: DUF4145 domain-containing protein [Acidimicrobiales bacterium]|nr:DUF4145 domain-containing protein [Acidimicrobiales bacterium]